MRSIFNEKLEETFLEKLAQEIPEILSKFAILFDEKIDLYVPKVLLEDKIEDFNAKLGLNLDIDSIAYCDSQKKDSFLLNIEAIMGFYGQEWSLKHGAIEDKLIREIVNKKEVKSSPSYHAHFDVMNDFILYNATINREASFGIKKLGFQKNEGIVYARSIKNPSMFTQITFSEIWRDKENSSIGHYLVSCKNSTSDELNHHLWFFPNRSRLKMNAFYALFEGYLMDNDENKKPIFEYAEAMCERDISDANINLLAKQPELVVDNSRLIDAIMNQRPSEHYRETIENIMARIETMFVPKDIAEEIESQYRWQLGDQKITLPNASLSERSFGLIEELDVRKVKQLMAGQYLGEKLDFMQHDNYGKLKFSQIYDENKTGEYSIYQLYVHRPSSFIEGEKFEAFLEIQNKNNPKNKFIFKIDELKKYNGRGIYTVELFTYGNKMEHHQQVIEADHDIAIDLPRYIRENILEENGYKSAPEFKHIYNRLKETSDSMVV